MQINIKSSSFCLYICILNNFLVNIVFLISTSVCTAGWKITFFFSFMYIIILIGEIVPCENIVNSNNNNNNNPGIYGSKAL